MRAFKLDVIKSRPMRYACRSEHGGTTVDALYTMLVFFTFVIFGSAIVAYVFERRKEPPPLAQRVVEFGVGKAHCLVPLKSDGHFVDFSSSPHGCGKIGEKALFRNCYTIIPRFPAFHGYKDCLPYPNLKKGVAFGKQ